MSTTYLTLDHSLEHFWFALSDNRLHSHSFLLPLVSVHNVTVNIVFVEVEILLGDFLREVGDDSLGLEEVPLVGLAVDDSLMGGVRVQGQCLVAFLAPGGEASRGVRLTKQSLDTNFLLEL